MALFETARLLVRRFTTGDAEGFFRINGDAEVMRYIRPAKTRPESDAFLQENIHFYQEGSVLGRYAVIAKDSPDIIGTFSFLYLDGGSGFHIGYALLPVARSKGYASEMVIAGVAYFFEKTDHPSLYAITAPLNTPSQKVLEKAGFSYRGTTHQHGEDLQLFYIDR
jgi:ribosomal-protein-alanine N-acetyltransferase